MQESDQKILAFLKEKFPEKAEAFLASWHFLETIRKKFKKKTENFKNIEKNPDNFIFNNLEKHKTITNILKKDLFFVSRLQLFLTIPCQDKTQFSNFRFYQKLLKEQLKSEELLEDEKRFKKTILNTFSELFREYSQVFLEIFRKFQTAIKIFSSEKKEIEKRIFAVEILEKIPGFFEKLKAPELREKFLKFSHKIPKKFLSDLEVKDTLKNFPYLPEFNLSEENIIAEILEFKKNIEEILTERLLLIKKNITSDEKSFFGKIFELLQLGKFSKIIDLLSSFSNEKILMEISKNIISKKKLSKKNLIRIVFLESEENFSQMISRNLAQEKFNCTATQLPEKILEICKQEKVDLLIFDFDHPKINGKKFLKKFRSIFTTMSILVISSENFFEIKKKLSEFDIDVFLEKPFVFQNLILKINSIFKTEKNFPVYPKEIKINNLKIDFKNKIATIASKNVQLSPKEFDILEYLVLRQGNICSRKEIWNNIDHKQLLEKTNSLEVHIMRIRKKIGKNYIKSVKKRGYFFDK